MVCGEASTPLGTEEEEFGHLRHERVRSGSLRTGLGDVSSGDGFVVLFLLLA